MNRSQDPIPRKLQRIGVGETIVKFLRKMPACSGPVHSAGTELYSYLLPIGRWKGQKIVIPRGSDRWSRTSRRHVGMLRNMATTLDIEIVEE